VWMIHHLQIIGEAASRLSQDARDQHPAVPWRQIIGRPRPPLVRGRPRADRTARRDSSDVRRIR
jgi:uncharacterized protein with HEPN domain